MAAEVVKGRHAKYRAANTTFGVNSEGRGVDHTLGPFSKGLYTDAFTGDKWAGTDEITVFAVASLTQQPPDNSFAHLLRIDANSDSNRTLLDLAIRFVSASGQLQMEGLLSTNGASGWTGSVFTDVMGASAFVIGKPYLFMLRYRSGQFLQYSLSKIGGPVAWVSSPYTPYGAVVGSSPSTPMEAHIGGLAHPGESNFPGTINLVGILPYSIPDSCARQLAANPWQVFEDEEDYVFVPAAGGGSSVSLAVADAAHAHAADNLTLSATGSASLIVQDATHSHVADGVALTTQWLLSVADAFHGHAADNVDLSTRWLLAVSDATHGHIADNLTLDTSNTTFLTVQDGAHSHTTDGIGLSLNTWLAIVDAAHAHTADAPTLSAQVALQIAESLHAHYADIMVLSFPGVMTLTPDDILAIVAALNANGKLLTVPTYLALKD